MKVGKLAPQEISNAIYGMGLMAREGVVHVGAAISLAEEAAHRRELLSGQELANIL